MKTDRCRGLDSCSTNPVSAKDSAFQLQFAFLHYNTMSSKQIHGRRSRVTDRAPPLSPAAFVC